MNNTVWKNRHILLNLCLGYNGPNKTSVINDSHSQTHSLASNEHCFLLKFVLFG